MTTEASINFGTGLSNAWSNVATFVPKFVVFLIILIIGYFIAKVLAKIVSKILTRVGFDRLVERGGIKTALERSKYDASGILAKIVYYAIMLFVLDVAFGVFGSNPISGFLHAIIAYLPLVFVAIVIIVIAAAIAAAVKSLIENSLSGMSYARVLGNLVGLHSGHRHHRRPRPAPHRLERCQRGPLRRTGRPGRYRGRRGRRRRHQDHVPAVGGGRRPIRRGRAAHRRCGRDAPGIAGQPRQAMPGDASSSSYGPTAAPPRPTQPYPRPDDGGDSPAGTGI